MRGVRIRAAAQSVGAGANSIADPLCNLRRSPGEPARRRSVEAAPLYDDQSRARGTMVVTRSGARRCYTKPVAEAIAAAGCPGLDARAVASLACACRAWRDALGVAPVLLAGLRDDSPLMRQVAAKAAAEVKHVGVVAALVENACDDGFPPARDAACRALGKTAAASDAGRKLCIAAGAAEGLGRKLECIRHPMPLFWVLRTLLPAVRAMRHLGEAARPFVQQLALCAVRGSNPDAYVHPDFREHACELARLGRVTLAEIGTTLAAEVGVTNRGELEQKLASKEDGLVSIEQRLPAVAILGDSFSLTALSIPETEAAAILASLLQGRSGTAQMYYPLRSTAVESLGNLGAAHVETHMFDLGTLYLEYIDVDDQAQRCLAKAAEQVLLEQVLLEKALVKVLRDGDDDIKPLAVAAVADLCNDVAYDGGHMRGCEALATAGVIPLLLNMLHEDDHYAMVDASSSLGVLAETNEEIREMIVAAGAVAPLIRQLSSQHDGWLQESAAGVLASLSWGSKARTALLVEHKAIEPLVAMLSSEDVYCCTTAATALTNISDSSPENAAAIQQAGAIGPLVEMLDVQREQGHSDAAIALANLCEGSPERTELVCAAGALTKLRDLLLCNAAGSVMLLDLVDVALCLSAIAKGSDELEAKVRRALRSKRVVAALEDLHRMALVDDETMARGSAVAHLVRLMSGKQATFTA